LDCGENCQEKPTNLMVKSSSFLQIFPSTNPMKGAKWIFASVIPHHVEFLPWQLLDNICPSFFTLVNMAVFWCLRDSGFTSTFS
jgi:hypothetical protein